MPKKSSVELHDPRRCPPRNCCAGRGSGPASLMRANLLGRFPKLVEWETGETQPTLKQLEAFAHAVHVPIGYLFLPTAAA